MRLPESPKGLIRQVRILPVSRHFIAVHAGGITVLLSSERFNPVNPGIQRRTRCVRELYDVARFMKRITQDIVEATSKLSALESDVVALCEVRWATELKGHFGQIHIQALPIEYGLHPLDEFV